MNASDSERVREILQEVFNDGFVLGEMGCGDDAFSTEKALEAISAIIKESISTKERA